MLPAPAPIFSPPPDAIDGLLHDLARPDISLLTLAATHNTTPESLALWMTSPGIRERLGTSADLLSWRTRFVAANCLHSALNVLSHVCENYTKHQSESRRSSHQAPPIPSSSSSYSSSAPSPSDSAPDPDPYRAAILSLRRAESARRAATTILRLANLPSIGAPTARSIFPEVQNETPPPSAAAPPSRQTTPRPAPPTPQPQPHPQSHPQPRVPATPPPSTRPPTTPFAPRDLPTTFPPSRRPLSPISSLLDLVGAPSSPTLRPP